MSTLTSTLPYAGTKISYQPRTIGMPKRTRTLHAAARRSAAGYLARMVASVRSATPETFYQDHAIAIFMGIFLETAMGPLLGIVGGYLFNHWIM